MIPERLRWLVAEDAPARRLGARFTDEGHSLYLVGGSLRDALLGRPADDLDFATDARPDDIVRLLRPVAEAVFTVGAEFGTVGAVIDGHTYEVTTFRSEVYRDESRKPHVTYSDDIQTDLSRRDFTVNAMALDLAGTRIEDPFDGLGDLASRRLRTPLAPQISFSDDPLRMLRLFRFVSTLDFDPDPAALAAVSDMADRLEIVSSERIRDELSKLLTGDEPARGLRGIVDSGLAGHFLPELVDLHATSDPYHRHKDVFEHTLAVVENTEPRLRLRMAALMHDVGKPATRAFGPGGVSFHHHEVVGARMTRLRMRELRYPKQLVEEVAQLVFLHLRPHTFKMGWTDSAVRRYVRDAGPLLDDLNQLVRCDVTTRNPHRAAAIQERIDELEERIEVLSEQEELAKLRPPIDGNDVMRLLGIEPGPRVGEIMRILMDHRIEHGPYSQEEAFEIVRAWAASRGIDAAT